MSFRYKRRGLRATLTACAVTVGAMAGTPQLASAFVPCPSTTMRVLSTRWETLWGTRSETAKGVTMCRGANIGGTVGYLQMVDLGDGAKLRVQAELEPRFQETQLENGNPDTVYNKRDAEEWYSFLRSKAGSTEEPDYGWALPNPRRLFSVINASFFTETENSVNTTVPWPVWTYNAQDSFGLSWRRARDGEVEEPIRFDSDYEEEKKVLYLQDPGTPVQKARVDPFPTYYELEDFGEYDHIGGRSGIFDTTDLAVGLTPERVRGEYRRRDYVGVYGDTVYMFVSRTEMRNAEASALMQEIQPGMEVIQMDGGGSTQVYSAYARMESNDPFQDRRVPVVLAAYRSETNEP